MITEPIYWLPRVRTIRPQFWSGMHGDRNADMGKTKPARDDTPLHQFPHDFV